MLNSSVSSSLSKRLSKKSKLKAEGISAAAAKLRLLKKLRCTLKFEKRAWASGVLHVAGVDEVGRGSLFGPVVAAAVILDPAYRIRGLRDSKLLPAERREMARRKLSPSEILERLQAVDAFAADGQPIAVALRAAGVLQVEYDQWRMEYAGLLRTLTVPFEPA